MPIYHQYFEIGTALVLTLSTYHNMYGKGSSNDFAKVSVSQAKRTLIFTIRSSLPDDGRPWKQRLEHLPMCHLQQVCIRMPTLLQDTTRKI